MKRVLPILASILLGALAVAIGMGLYLKQANDDRQRLAQTADQAKQALQKVQDESQQTVAQANAKISEATDEVQKMQAQLKAVQDERSMMAAATMLIPASGKTIKGWTDAIDVPLGIALKYPAANHEETNDAQSLTVVKDSPQHTEPASVDSRWLSITPYDVRLEQELLSTLATSTPVSYVVHGRLLLGQAGTTTPSSTDSVLVLRAMLNGTTTQLIWVREPTVAPQKPQLLDVVSTISFPQ